MALNLFRFLMPADQSFTALFCEQAKAIAAAGEELRRLVEGEGAVEEHVAEISAIETQADSVARRIFLAANRTFNAPIDREDIITLGHDLDDVVDLIEDAAKAIQRYQVRDFPAEMRRMADAIVRSAAALEEAIPLLDAITREYRTILQLCERVARVEGEADECFDFGLTRLRERLRHGGVISKGQALDAIKTVVEVLRDTVDGRHDPLADQSEAADALIESIRNSFAAKSTG